MHIQWKYHMAPLILYEVQVFPTLMEPPAPF